MKNMVLEPICQDKEYCCYHSIDCFFKKRTTDEGYVEYFRREKLPSGMTAEFIYELFYYGRSREEYKLLIMPSFVVYKNATKLGKTQAKLLVKMR